MILYTISVFPCTSTVPARPSMSPCFPALRRPISCSRPAGTCLLLAVLPASCTPSIIVPALVPATRSRSACASGHRPDRPDSCTSIDPVHPPSVVQEPHCDPSVPCLNASRSGARESPARLGPVLPAAGVPSPRLTLHTLLFSNTFLAFPAANSPPGNERTSFGVLCHPPFGGWLHPPPRRALRAAARRLIPPPIGGGHRV